MTGGLVKADGSPSLSLVAFPTVSFQKPTCPNCNSNKVWCDGLRKNPNKGKVVQRYLCRECGYRFSSVKKQLNTLEDNLLVNQISVREKAKNLVSEQNKVCLGDAKLSVEVQGLLIQLYSYLEKNAYVEENPYPRIIKHLAYLGANLHDPENVKAIIAKMMYTDRKTGETVKVKNGTKMLYCAAYGTLAKMLKIQWENPCYTQEEKEVYVPYESELDTLINAARSRRMAAYLQTLKETWVDPSEALRIEWRDIDEKKGAIAINHPVKNHNSGTIQVSAKLLSMLSALPHTHERVFPIQYSSLIHSYIKFRRRVADIQHNPRLLAVELRGFRHWGGTMIAYNTNGNVLEVKRLLRHKNVKSTMKYIGKIDFKNDDFETTSASTVDEVLKLGGEGWIEYSVVKVGSLEVHCFKKPKRFRSA